MWTAKRLPNLCDKLTGCSCRCGTVLCALVLCCGVLCLPSKDSLHMCKAGRQHGRQGLLGKQASLVHLRNIVPATAARRVGRRAEVGRRRRPSACLPYTRAKGGVVAVLRGALPVVLAISAAGLFKQGCPPRTRSATWPAAPGWPCAAVSATWGLGPLRRHTPAPWDSFPSPLGPTRAALLLPPRQ